MSSGFCYHCDLWSDDIDNHRAYACKMAHWIPTKGCLCDKCGDAHAADTASDLAGQSPTFVRTFETGATRDTDAGKLDYDGFLSPLVLKRYAEYMHENRTLKDGSVRDGGNWKQGIPKDAYMKSGWRHHMEFWSLHHGYGDGDIERAICACIFNLSGYLHELLKDGERLAYPPPPYPDEDFA